MEEILDGIEEVKNSQAAEITETDMTRTKGGVIIDNLQIGDIVVEEEFGESVTTEIVTKPELYEDYWSWEARIVETGEIVQYGQYKYCPLHYALNLRKVNNE